MLYFSNINESLEEATRIHGVSFSKTLSKIVLPLMAGALFNSWVFVFNSSMKELSASAILGTRIDTAIIVAYLLFADGYFSKGVAITLIVTSITLLITAIASFFTKKGIGELRERG